jgi:hypothetical protein
MQAGDEVLFEYGRHNSGTLFAEYGFIEGCYTSLQVDTREGRNFEATHSEWLDKENGCVDLSDCVKTLWDEAEMDAEERKEKEDALAAVSCME